MSSENSREEHLIMPPSSPRIPPAKAEKLVRELTEKHQLDRKESIQIANSMPRSYEELRTILTVKGRIISATQLEDILKLVNTYREE